MAYCIDSSVDPDQLTFRSPLIRIHSFQLNLNLVYKRVYINGIKEVRAKLRSLCIICSLGQVKYSLDKYIMVIYLPLGK